MEHGIYKASIVGAVINTKLIGSFNIEGMRRYVDHVKQLVTSFNGEEFAMMVDNTELIGGTPEAIEALQSYNLWLNDHNITAKAMIVNSAAIEDLAQTHISAYKQQNIRYFSCIDDAQLWLDQCMQ